MDIVYDITQVSPPKPGADSFNHLIDIRSLEFLAAMISKILRLNYFRPEQFRGNRIEAELWGHRRRVDRALIKAGIHNLKTRLKWAMIGNAEWRGE